MPLLISELLTWVGVDRWTDGRMDGWNERQVDALLMFSLTVAFLINPQAALLIKKRHWCYIKTSQQQVTESKGDNGIKKVTV